MKILNVAKFYSPYRGGIETVVKNMTVSNIAQGYQSDVLCSNTNFLNETNLIDGALVKRSARICTLKSTSICPFMPFQLKGIANDYDLLHVHFPDPMSALSLYVARPSKPFIIHWHSDIIKQRNMLALYRPLQDWCLQNASAIIVTSPNYLEYSECLKPFLNKTHIVPIGISSDLAFNERKVGETKKILSVGRLTSYKGFRVLIDAISYLPPDYDLVIIGDGELKQELHQQIQKSNLDSRVTLLGQVDDIELRRQFLGSDIFCLSSIDKSEAFGVVLIEAMSNSLPIVATDILGSGVPWVNEHGVTGLNVEVGNAEQLAKALQQIAANADAYRKYSLNSFSRFKNEFQLETMMNRIWSIYRHILK